MPLLSPLTPRRHRGAISPLQVLVATVLLLALPACGAPEDGVAAPVARTPQPTGDPPVVLAGIEKAARDAGTVRYEAIVESGRDAAELQVEGGITGVLDVQAGSGTAAVELLPLQDMAADAADEDAAAAADLAALSHMQLSWTGEDITVGMGGEQWTGPRADADSGLISRIPGEAAGLFAVVAAAREVATVGVEEVDGQQTTRYRAVVAPGAAIDAGLGTQAHLAIAELPELPLEVWVDDAGRAVRIRYSFTVPSLIEGSTRTTVTTYDYTAWGQPINLGR